MALNTMNTKPIKTPKEVMVASSATPSAIKLKLAAIMSPAAKALADPKNFGLNSLAKKNGTAPNPVATAVINAAINTQVTGL